MKRLNYLLLVALVIFSVPAIGQEIYKWTDEKGTLHFADDPNQIPAKYQDQVEIKKIPEETSADTGAPSLPRPGVQKTNTEPMPRQAKPVTQPPERKDILGRGADWWSGQVRQWKEKLTDAQKNQASAIADLKNKEKELADAKFKPDSLKRKLKAEMKTMMEKVNASNKEVEEAKNMLDNVLPKQAQEYNADPNWLR